MKKSEKIALTSLIIGIIAGLFFHFYFGCNGLVSTILGVLFFAGISQGALQGAAARSVIDSKTINRN